MANERKRQRNLNPRGDKVISAVKKQKRNTHASSLEDLKWKSVPTPDRLEDAEGFFGLEEVEDVDVIRDETSGRIEFRASDFSSTLCCSRGANNVQVPSQGGDEAKERTEADPEQTNRQPVVPFHDDGGDDWQGFDDKPDAQVAEAKTQPAQKSTARLDSKNSKKKDPKRLKKNKTSPPSSGKANAFAGLDGEDDIPERDVDVSAWSTLRLSPDTLSALAKHGFEKPTAIQSASIPEILAGHDVVGKASTGSGKTLAFGIPILEFFLEKGVNHKEYSTSRSEGVNSIAPTALIISPTRELAHQLQTHLTALCSQISPRAPSIITITGGMSAQKQQRLLSKADVIIGTPGRLWETINGGHGLLAWLKRVKFFIIDEADRLLSEGHFKEFEQILDVLKAGEDAEEHLDSTDLEQRQTLVFSATFERALQQRLAGKAKPGGDRIDRSNSMSYLLDKLKFREGRPKFIDVNPARQMAEGLEERLVECAALEKDLYLYALLLHHPKSRTLVFTNSISAVRRLTPLLRALNLPAHALHSQMAQKARLRSVERFTAPSETGCILVATDVAARGLDIPRVQLILHYHVPRAADTYVHRSGRTARADLSGSSILLCAPDEVAGVGRLIAKVHSDTSRGGGGSRSRSIRSIDLNRQVVARLKPRVALAKKIVDSELAKEKKGHERDWMQTAAEELGVDYDSDEYGNAASSGRRKGRGSGREKAEREARARPKDELAALRAELRALLSQRINVGVSERYLTAGHLDVDALLQGNGQAGDFLGAVEGLGLGKS